MEITAIKSGSLVRIQPRPQIRAISSMAERSLDVRKVIGSSPISPTNQKIALCTNVLGDFLLE